MPSLPHYQAIEPGRHLYFGMAEFDMAWMAECLALFKREQIVIRSLLIRPDFQKPEGRYRYFQLECRSPQAQFEGFKQRLILHFNKVDWQ